MKKQILLILLFVSSFVVAQQQTVTYNVTPNPFDENQSITISFDGASINEATWGVTDNSLFLWAWSFDLNDSNIQDSPTNGSWTNSNSANQLTYDSGSDTYSITFIPTTFYARTGIGRIGFLIKAQDGTGDKKSQDVLVEVGIFQLDLTSPTDDITIVSAGSTVSINATTTENADFNLKANGTSINTATSTMNYSFSPVVNETTTFQLDATNSGTTLTETFQVVATPSVVQEAIPTGIVEGVNYDDSDATKVTLALRAPNKDYIYIAGSFNNYTFDDNYVMKQDTSDNDLYWLEITGLTSGQIETFQYWVIDETPIANSPSLVKAADPYSTLVLSPFDDPGIPSASYPSIPTYPTGQEREVTVIQTGQTPYPWVVGNFDKPKKEDLVIYEVLIRDFDADRNFQNLIDRIDYFKNLNINAIQLMPVMEYEGNESWGYNTSFHMALDKFYGTADKFKEFVDLCHQNDIAVILDIALNHAFGRNPMVRMWMNDPDNDGWGEPSTENPYFNTSPRHSFNVGSDFNHQSTLTQGYVERVVNYWISEFKVDGFRWDLTKGFTQNCTGGDDACTNSFQQDRVDILKQYADYSWSIDPTHFVIFEHLGTDTEEQEWANYRIGDAIPKGIMMWGIMTSEYTDFVQGFTSNISRATHQSRGFTEPRLIAYPESHDEERIMYEAVNFGNNSNASHNVRNLDVALKRMSSMGAVSLTLPGPKMVWHFGALGMENSIFTCPNGTVNNPGCKLDTKPQPQWTDDWLNDTDRRNVYDTWARLIDLKINEEVFEGDATLEGTTQSVRLFFSNPSIPDGQLKNVVILANFRTIDQNITPDFATTGTWYDLMDNSPITVTNTTDLISVPAGEFRIYGNAQTTLSNDDISSISNTISLYPNPTDKSFQINTETSEVSVYNLLGKIVANFKGNHSQNTTFSLGNLETGVYIVKARTNQGVLVKRVMKK